MWVLTPSRAPAEGALVAAATHTGALGTACAAAAAFRASALPSRVLARHLQVAAFEHELDLAVDDEHHGGTDTTEDVGEGTLVHAAEAFVLEDLDTAVDGALVETLVHRLVGLHLEATADSVERVGDEAGGRDGDLRDAELGGDGDRAGLLGVRVEGHDGVVEAELGATVRDDTGDRRAEAVVQGEETTRAGGRLLEAVEEAVELGLAGADVRGEAGTGVVKRVHNGERRGTGGATRGELDAEERPELGLAVELGESTLDGVLEGQVERLGREVTDDVGHVTTPERGEALLAHDAGEAVADAGVAGDFARHNPWVSILGLDDELDALDGGGQRLGDGAGDTARQEVNHEAVVFTHDERLSLKMISPRLERLPRQLLP